MAAPKQGSAGCVVVAAILVVAGAGAGAYFFMHRNDGADDIVSWAGGSTMCLADVDGDGKDDLVGTAGFPDMHLVGVEARSGKIVWRHKIEATHTPQVFCGGGGILTTEPFDMVGVDGLDPKTGDKKWSISLSDKMDKIAWGKGCAVIDTVDKKRTSIDLGTGKATDCKDAGQPRSIYAPDKAVRTDDLEVALVSKGEGTPKLGVQASRQGKTVWEADLSAIAFDGAGIMASQYGVVVGGIDRGSKELVLTLLDRSTGSTLKTKKEKVHDASSVTMAGHDRAVFVQTFGQIHTYDPQSLELLWWGGTFWKDH
ncbi:MAG: PQQ-binding-like beta-propeller repeat protein [Polyangiaceae bacterium]